jgi:RNA-directed DNA polymerase
VLSPLLSNIYLDPLDHLIEGLGYQMVRYADDFVILCRTPEEASRALEEVRHWVEANGLTLHPTKTKVVNARTEGFDFLGYRFQSDERRPRDRSLAKFKETIRAKTKRTNGNSLATIITTLNRTLRGWFAYFKHSGRWVFKWLDGWIRRRLRSILSRRAGLSRRHGVGQSHRRWPNAYFAELGLMSLALAHESVCQSSQR